MKNIHEVITNQIIESMKNSTGFEMPWHRQSTLPVNALTTKAYSGINTLSLWVAALQREYSSNHWATYKQWQSMGGQVDKGEKGSCIVIYMPLPVSEADENKYPKAHFRSATVFNAEQVSGVGFAATYSGQEDSAIQLQAADQFVANSGISIGYGGDQAYYSPSKDKIVMPERERFLGTDTSNPTEAFYSTLLHELIHSTGHKSRCARDLSSRFGSSGYAIEELVAELGAAFLCSDLKIAPYPRQDHANYLSEWLAVLGSDQKAIFWAASRASEAVNYLNSLQSK